MQIQHFLLVHVKKKPFKCNLCDVGFTENAGFYHQIAKVHENKKDANSRVFWFQCGLHTLAGRVDRIGFRGWSVSKDSLPIPKG